MAFFLRPNSQVMTDTNGNMFAELYADEATDLADNLEGVDLAAGSIALVIASGDFYVLNSSSVWVNQNAEDTPSASVNKINSTKSLTVNIEEPSERKIDESSEETEDEPEKEKESEQSDELERSAESNTRATSKR